MNAQLKSLTLLASLCLLKSYSSFETTLFNNSFKTLGEKATSWFLTSKSAEWDLISGLLAKVLLWVGVVLSLAWEVEFLAAPQLKTK